MTRLDPIIGVKDVETSSQWYKSVFGCLSIHGGSEFDILTYENDEVLICLHKWGSHEHPTMLNSEITPGNGLILYIRTENMKLIRKNLERMEYSVETEIKLNPNSGKEEFSVRDLDGYCLVIADWHNYRG